LARLALRRYVASLQRCGVLLRDGAMVALAEVQLGDAQFLAGRGVAS
jgi:hypothetical protein